MSGPKAGGMRKGEDLMKGVETKSDTAHRISLSNPAERLNALTV